MRSRRHPRCQSRIASRRGPCLTSRRPLLGRHVVSLVIIGIADLKTGAALFEAIQAEGIHATVEAVAAAKAAAAGQFDLDEVRRNKIIVQELV